jgi:uncharacterized protein
MTAAHVVELASVAPQPWRNGGGVTREVLAWPPGSGSDWLLRISVAEIERDGPFSPFPGVQRCFTVLEGAGVVLGFGEGEQMLTRESPPLGFDGAAAPSCRLVDGPTRDLNLMARASAGRPLMRPVDGAAPADSGPATRWRGIYTAEPLRLAVGDATTLVLPPHSLAWSDAAAPWLAMGAAPAPRAWWLSLEQP